MGDAKRLRIIYSMISDAHKAISPDLRIGQFLDNFLVWHRTAYDDGIYFVKDTELLDRFEEYAKEVTGNDELFSD